MGLTRSKHPNHRTAPSDPAKFNTNTTNSRCCLLILFTLCWLVQTIAAETTDFCNDDNDCAPGERFCHENRCMCPRERPVEDRENMACLEMSLINEYCTLDSQCLSESKCIDNICACSPDQLRILNPSTKVYYCHPKRRLNEDCNYDIQCPENAFCSTKKHGCLCQNGYGASIVRKNGTETQECLPKICKLSSDCESEYHICDESKCKCLATHFDPHTALCYEFGSTGGQLADLKAKENDTIAKDIREHGNGIKSILKDLTIDGQKMWLVIVVITMLMLLLLILIILLVRRFCLGYCWTMHKKEYEPNNENVSKNQFDKNSINNKSFRRKRADLEADDDKDNGSEEDEEEEEVDNTAADRSNLVTTTSTTGSNNNTSNRQQKGVKSVSRSPFGGNGTAINGNNRHYVKVDMSNAQNLDEDLQYASSKEDKHYQHLHQVLNRPLASSTSTPV